jgi:hypothetical protein
MLFIDFNMQACSFKMKYDGYSTKSVAKSIYRREKVYNLQIVKIGAIKGSDPVAPDWAAEAAEQPLMPAQLPRSVPLHWLMTGPSDKNYLFLKIEQFKTFMDQIGQPFSRRIDVL